MILTRWALISGIDILENQVKEAKQMVEESDIKYDEAARKLAMVSLKNIRLFRDLSVVVDICRILNNVNFREMGHVQVVFNLESQL